NTAAYGGGMFLGSSAEARDVRIEANTATTAGGGVYMGEQAEVRDSQILSNVSDGGGGGIYASDTDWGRVLAANCVIENNVAATEGGGALVDQWDFLSIASDWGSGASDNDPDDLTFYATADSDPITLTDLEAAEDFLCS